MTLPFHSVSTGLSKPYLQHHVSVQSSSYLIIVVMVDLALSGEILLVSLYLEPLVDNFLFIISKDPSVPSYYMLVIFVYKTRVCITKWNFVEEGL